MKPLASYPSCDAAPLLPLAGICNCNCNPDCALSLGVVVVVDPSTSAVVAPSVGEAKTGLSSAGSSDLWPDQAGLLRSPVGL